MIGFGYKLVLIITFFGLFLSSASSVYAASTSLDNGQNHVYSVYFQDEGEAFVSARYIFANNTDEDIDTYRLDVPASLSPYDIAAYQAIKKTSCIEYQYESKFLSKAKDSSGVCGNYTTLNACDSAQAKGAVCSWYTCANTCLLTGTSVEKVCNSAKRFCAQSAPAIFGNSEKYLKYSKIHHEIASVLTLSLSETVSPGSSGVILLFFKTNGFAVKNSHDVYEYEITPLGVDDTVGMIRIAVSTDLDWVLSDDSGHADFGSYDISSIESINSTGNDPVSYNILDAFYKKVGDGRVVKLKRYIRLTDEYVVVGQYAESKFKLIAGELISAAVGFVMVLVAAIIGVWFLYKGFGKRAKEIRSKIDSQNTGHTGGMVSLIFVVSTGLVSAIAVSGYTVSIFFMMAKISSWMDYIYSLFLGIFLIVISSGVYVVIGVLPSVYIGLKRGVRSGMWALISTIGWLLIFFALAIVVSIAISSA